MFLHFICFKKVNLINNTSSIKILRNSPYKKTRLSNFLFLKKQSSLYYAQKDIG